MNHHASGMTFLDSDYCRDNPHATPCHTGSAATHKSDSLKAGASSVYKRRLFRGFLQQYFSIHSTHTMLPLSLVRSISTAPFYSVKDLFSGAASHLQSRPLLLQDVYFLVNVYSNVYGTPVMSGGQSSPDAPDLFNNVSPPPRQAATALT